MTGSDKQHMDSPIFIVGSPRSGTTLLAKILGRHSHIFMPGETHYFSDIYVRQKEIGDLSTFEARDLLWDRLVHLYEKYNEPSDQARINQLLKEREFIESLKGALCSYEKAHRVFMELQAIYVGKVRWGNNTPKDIFHVPEIKKVYPNAKFIVCVRDIRDFLGSYKNKWRVTSKSQEIRLQRLYHPVITSFLWRASMKLVAPMQKALGHEKLFVVKYEQLVANAESVVKNVCDYLGEQYEREMLNVEFSNSSGSNEAKGIYSTSVGTWKSRISEEECWIAQLIGGSEMKALGYRKERVEPRRLRVSILFITALPALWRALRTNKSNTGPIVSYIIKRVGALVSK